MRPDSWREAKWEGEGQLDRRSQKLREGLDWTQTAKKKEQQFHLGHIILLINQCVGGFTLGQGKYRIM